MLKQIHTQTHTTAIMGGKKGGCASGGLVRETVAIWQPVQQDERNYELSQSPGEGAFINQSSQRDT